MSCEFYQKYELAPIEKDAFDRHLKNCPECRLAFEQDQKLLRDAAGLNTQIDAPLLWGKIENALRAEIQREERYSQPAPVRNWYARPVFRLAMAAVFLVAVSVGIVVIQKETQQPEASSRLLTATTLEQVRHTEKAYEEAIARLETTATKKISQMNIELALLYRDKLETIDTQIQHCRDALAQNPGNAHIRRYMLAALQDKRTTLEELLKNPENAL